jgi:putative two-component system response regulator
LKAAAKNPPHLMLLDISMPEMDGYEVCRRMKADPALCGIPIIFLSALNATEDKVKAFGLGGVDYITKPFQIEEVLARVNTYLKIRELQSHLEFDNLNLQALVDMKVKALTAAQLATIFAMAKLAESRDEDTGKHLERVQEYCRRLALKLMADSPYSEQITPELVDLIHHATPLHDIGKVAIPDAVLLKPDRLTDAEMVVMRTHAEIGEQTLRTVLAKSDNAFVRVGIDIAGGHHERWDGSGYPRKLRGEEIPLAARIMALTDVYDALRSERCYKKPIPHPQVVEMIRAERGRHFDPVVVDGFLKLEAEFDHIRTTLE